MILIFLNKQQDQLLKLKQKVDKNLKVLVEEQKKIEQKLKTTQCRNGKSPINYNAKRTGSPKFTYVKSNCSPANNYSHVQSRFLNHHSEEKKLRQETWKSPNINASIQKSFWKKSGDKSIKKEPEMISSKSSHDIKNKLIK